MVMMKSPSMTLLLDVLDVDVAGGEVGGDARDDALLVAPDDGHDGTAPAPHGRDRTDPSGAVASSPGPTTTPSAWSAASSSGPSPSTSASTESLCSPSSGPGPRTRPASRRAGTAGRRGGPFCPPGVGTSTKWPRAASCGSRAHRSAALATRPAATPAAWSRVHRGLRLARARPRCDVAVELGGVRAASGPGREARIARPRRIADARRRSGASPSSSKTVIAIQRSSPAHG